MRNFIFTAVLFFSFAVQAAEIVLPAALPNDDGKENVAAPINQPSKDVFEGTVLPNPVPIASANSADFEFPAINPDDVLAQMPNAKRPRFSASPLVPIASKSPEYETDNKSEAVWLKAIRHALITKNAGENIVLEAVRYGHRIEEAKKATPGIWLVQDVASDEQTGRFSGKLVATGQESIPFSGRFGAMQTVPVLKSRLSSGTVISQNDVELRPILVSRLRNSTTITDPKELVGKSLRRMIGPGMPLRTFDLSQPAIIAPNSEVEMVYSSGSIEVSDRGVALEKGAVGDIIRVKNGKSGAVLRARVDSATKVSVGYFAPRTGEHYATN